MKSLIIYESVHHGNTEKVAKAMAEILKSDILNVNDVNDAIIEGYDLVGFGSGIYYSNLHEDIIGLIDSIKPVHNKRAFVFSTSGQGRKQYNEVVEEKLRKKNFQLVGSFVCKGYDTYGPFEMVGGIAQGRPNERDLEKAREFIESICEI